MQTSYYSLIERIDRYVSSPSENSSSDNDVSSWNSDDSWASSQSPKVTAIVDCFKDAVKHPAPGTVVSFSDNYERSILEMEEVAIKYIVEPDVPVLSTMMKDLNHHHIDKILKTYQRTFPSVQERAVVLSVLFDLVSCCSQQGPLSTSYEFCKSPIRMKQHLAKLKEEFQDVLYSRDAMMKMNHLQLQSMKKLLGASVSRLPISMENGFHCILDLLDSKINILEKEDITRRYFPMYDFKTEEDFEGTPVKSKAKKHNKTPTQVNKIKQPPVTKTALTSSQVDTIGFPDCERALFSNIRSPDEVASDMFRKWQSKMSLAKSCGSNEPEVYQSKSLNKRENVFPLKYGSSNQGACTSSDDEDFINESLHDDIYLPNVKVTSHIQTPDSSRNVLTSSENTELFQPSTKRIKLTKESTQNGEVKPYKNDGIVSYSDSTKDLSFHSPEATEAKWRTTSSSVAVETCKSGKIHSIYKKKLNSSSASTCASSTKHHSSSTPHSSTAIEGRYLTDSTKLEEGKSSNTCQGNAMVGEPEKMANNVQSSLKTGAQSGKKRSGTLLDWLNRYTN